MTAAAMPNAGRRVTIIQGEFHVATDHAVSVTTVLGSCVAACLFDTGPGVGGMNHFLLPEGSPGMPTTHENLSYGTYAMELLINGLLKVGASRTRMKAKLFGGARMFSGLTDIGGRNAAFARRFLADEGIELVGSSLGGEVGRRIEFHPSTGRARQVLLGKGSVDQMARREREPVRVAPDAGTLELF